MREFFGEVKWYKDDLVNALECCNYPLTENNIEKLYNLCNNHWFVDYMIEMGFEYMYNHIGMGDGWDKEE